MRGDFLHCDIDRQIGRSPKQINQSEADNNCQAMLALLFRHGQGLAKTYQTIVRWRQIRFDLRPFV